MFGGRGLKLHGSRAGSRAAHEQFGRGVPTEAPAGEGGLLLGATVRGETLQLLMYVLMRLEARCTGLRGRSGRWLRRLLSLLGPSSRVLEQELRRETSVASSNS